MNILLLGGNHNLSLHIIEKLLFLNKQFKLIIVDNNISRNDIRNNFCNVYEHYGYLENDCMEFIYADINNVEKIKDVCKNYEIEYIINNVKYNQNYDFNQNYKNLVNGYGNLLNYCYDESLNIKKVINIYRRLTNRSYNLIYNKNRNTQYESRGFNDTQKCLKNFFDKDDKIITIEYNDYLFGDKNYCNTLIEKYIYMFKIGDKPYAHDIVIYLNDIEELVANIFVILFFPNRHESMYTLNKDLWYNVQNELIPTLIKHINTTRQDKKYELDYYSQNKQKKTDINEILHEKIIKMFDYSINKIFN